MIRFNLIGTGFLDFEEKGSLAFKKENPHFRFADVSLARSVEFTIPATDRNRLMLDYGEDPSTDGDMLRTLHSVQMVYDGGAVLGTLAITAYEGNAFKCVFYLGGADWIDRLQDLQLSDCPTSFTKGVLWSASETPVNANSADPSSECQLVQYDNGLGDDSTTWQTWQLVPSVNVKTFIEDVLTEMGITHSINVDEDYWMVAGSMKGGTEDSVTFNVTGTNAGTVTSAQGYFSPVSFTLGWARNIVFGNNVNGGSTTAIGFQANYNVEITFPQSVTTPLFLIKWSTQLWRCKVLGGKYASAFADGVEPLAGRTISITQGDIIFFAETPMFATDSVGLYIGWKDIATSLSLTCTVSRNEDLSIGEVWHLGVNMPDCTIFEFLKSVAAATGLELTIDPTNGITIDAGSYGSDFVVLDDVISVESVERCVDCWGNSVNKAKIVFDSDDYVTDNLSSEFSIESEIRDEEFETKVFFSEGNQGGDGVLIEDVTVESSTYKFAAKKWTLAYADAGESFLHRVSVPNPVGYDDLAANSTCIKVKVAMSEADFFDLAPSTTILWRGMAYLWTDADWSDGVVSLTLQKVSQMTTS